MRSRFGFGLWAAFAGCSGGDTPTDGVSPDPVVTALTCTADFNVLRYHCDVATSAPAAVTVTISAEGETPLVFRSSELASAHTVATWGYTALTTWSVSAAVDGGSGDPVVTTVDVGELPDSVDNAATVVVDTPEAVVDTFLVNFGCVPYPERVLIYDRHGHLRWYQPIEALGGTSVRGMQVTPEQTVLAVIDHQAIAEWNLAGELVFEAQRGAGDPPFHHDAHRRGDYVYGLFSEVRSYPDGDYVLDGFKVFDRAATPIAEWHLADMPGVAPTGGLPNPGGVGYWGGEFDNVSDWSHTNSIWVDDDGNAVLSFRYQEALMQIGGDPDAPGFAEHHWTLVGGTHSQLTTTLALTSAVTDDLHFEDQHGLWSPGPGEYMFLDNGDMPGVPSRALRVRVDAAAATAEITEVWPVPESCPGQGSAFLLGNGDALVDCAQSRTIYELAPTTGDVQFALNLECPFPGINLRPLYRATPISLQLGG